jgi:aminoglycoside phosphotransferase (APT) family kinase protein
MSKAIPAILDRDISGLSTVLNPIELGNYLSPILPSIRGTLQNVEIQVLRHHRGRRCTVEIMLQTTTGRYELIGKVYAKDRSDVYRAMKLISESGFGPEAEFSVAQPLAYLPEINLLLQEKVQGPSAKQIFLTGNESERVKAAERCARWLAHFHAQAPQTGPVFAFSPELGEYWVDCQAKRLEPETEALREKAMLLFKGLKRTAPTLASSEMCACHGDYSPRHIILTEAQTATFDWDSCCVADLSWDLAKFIIKIEQLALLSHSSPDAPIEAFYETYTAVSGFEVAKRLPFYKAMHCLKHTKSLRKKGKQGIVRTEALLDKGIRILAEEMRQVR